MDKSALRRRIRAQKSAMTETQIEEKSRRLGALLRACPLYREARSIYGYLPYNQEVRTVPILAQALAEGKQVAVPRCRDGQLEFLWIRDLDRVQPGPWGIPEPVDGPLADDGTALVLLPGLAFDRAGGRIGYGGGYYDRFLAREPNHPTLALCYDFQLFDRLETEEFDIPADLVLWA